MVDNIEEFREMMKDPEFEKQVLSGTKSLTDTITIFRRLGLSDDLIMEVVSSALAALALIEKEEF